MKYLIIMIVLCFTSCHPLSCNWNAKYTAVTDCKKEDVCGIFKLRNESNEYLSKKEQYWTEYLTLKLNEDNVYDGDFIFTNTANKILKSGKWRIFLDSNSEILIELEGVTVEPLGMFDRKLNILITLGDGDNCEGIVYSKL